jgi:hypothetical protein
MTGSTSTHQNQRNQKANSIETLHDRYQGGNKTTTETTGSVYEDTKNSFKKLGTDVFDQLFGRDKGNTSDTEQLIQQESSSERKINRSFTPQFGKESVNIFSWREQEERKEIQQLKELIQMIKQEVELIKKQDSSLMGDVQDIEKLTLQSLPEKSSVYHVRFLEIILGFLKNLRAKIGESQTWLEALKSKKQKRGSAFKKLSQEQGTQYSLSQEFSVRNSVQ